VGGDEFVIFADSARDPQGLKSLAARVLRCFDEPFVADAFPPLRLTASIGGVFADKGFKGSAEKLIELADQAMFESKKAGKGRSAFIFAGDMESP
jgi:GGDEF domain-containing protein